MFAIGGSLNGSRGLAGFNSVRMFEDTIDGRVPRSPGAGEFAQRIAEQDLEAGQRPPCTHCPVLQPRRGRQEVPVTRVTTRHVPERDVRHNDRLPPQRRNSLAPNLDTAAEGNESGLGGELATRAAPIAGPRNPQRALAPMAATLPDGTPYSDPFLAVRGCEAQGGLCVRRRSPLIWPRRGCRQRVVVL